MNLEGESIKPEDEDGIKDIDTKDIDSDKTEGDENEMEKKTRSLNLSGSADKVSRPLRILVVEDDASTRRSLNRLVNTLGHRAHVTQNMREALDLAISENETFDLLLSDISLPDGDGWELLENLSDAGLRPWRAVAISGRCSTEDLARSQTAGFYHLLAQTRCTGNPRSNLARSRRGGAAVTT